MHPERHPRRLGAARTATAVVIIATLGLGACGDDDDESVSTDAPAPTSLAVDTTTPDSAGSSGSADSAEFCTLAEEINSQEGFPTLEQVEEYAAAAPDELAEPIALVLDLMRSADGDLTAVFADPAGGEALGAITTVEAELCGFEAPEVEAGPPQDPSVIVIDPAATRVDVEGVDYGFDADFPSEAGRYSFVMTNAGEEPHIMILIRLEDGATLQEALDSEGEQGVAEEFESNPAMPGAEGVLTADLGPGQWVMLCPIPDGAGTPHFASGMIHEFEIA